MGIAKNGYTPAGVYTKDVTSAGCVMDGSEGVSTQQIPLRTRDDIPFGADERRLITAAITQNLTKPDISNSVTRCKNLRKPEL